MTAVLSNAFPSAFKQAFPPKQAAGPPGRAVFGRAFRSVFKHAFPAKTPVDDSSSIQAELRAQLREIEAKLNSGVTSVTVDGTTTQINHNFLRKRANDLRKRIAGESGRRPVASSIYLGGF